MTFTINEGQIFIHKNQNAEGNKPVMRGSMMIGGTEYEIALWGSKSGKDGSYSGKVQLPRQKPETGHASPTETHKGYDQAGNGPSQADRGPIDDSEIPF